MLYIEREIERIRKKTERNRLIVREKRDGENNEREKEKQT